MVDSLLYAQNPLQLKRFLKLAFPKNGAYNHIVAHLERELEISGLDDDGELTKPTITTVPLNDNQQITEQTKIVCHYCKKPSHVVIDCREKRKKNRGKEMILRIKKTRNLRHPDDLHTVIIANEQNANKKMLERSQ